MTSVQEHYDRHLGPVYAWMVGGIASALEHGDAEIESLGLRPSETGVAVDLGAGFGMHAVPLARRGFKVLAVDSCQALLDELRTQKDILPIEIAHADLLSFPRHLPGKPELVLCMGDTLTHLSNEASVERLITLVRNELTEGGLFVMTFRDYTTPVTGVRRFIPVRSDAQRIFTCFLEYAESHVMVYDIVNDWKESGWTQKISAYPKLRLAPEWLCRALRLNGFTVEQSTGPAGMLRFVSQRV